jgi:preprotein translocase subunit SecB
MELSYRVADSDEPDATAGSERKISLGWDWRVFGKRTFEVALLAEIGPSADHADTATATVGGVFHAAAGSLSVDFAQFVREHAPAILFPYLREHISALTSRGPYGPFHLASMNIVQLVRGFDDRATEGARELETDAALAAEFELEYYTAQYPKR